ncbi:hypothetical protein FB567DRAFT_261001 [Paraphoma chrysanthemicola]|uniref:Uncharacterized protein n=1 Tax=Paraphoma chrysanthemicola TaxID=798071 RepID=A0A8K0VQV0_9PLEO|nr:hypothetical protein FB567DRAFT_261001 [Paraphoma chrysanthemicola]
MATRNQRTAQNAIEILQLHKRLPITEDRVKNWLRANGYELAQPKTLHGQSSAILSLLTSQTMASFEDLRTDKEYEFWDNDIVKELATALSQSQPRCRPLVPTRHIHDWNHPVPFLTAIRSHKRTDLHHYPNVPEGEPHHGKPDDDELLGTDVDVDASIAYYGRALDIATDCQPASILRRSIQDASRRLYKTTTAKGKNSFTIEYHKAGCLVVKLLIAWSTETTNTILCSLSKSMFII